MWYGAKKGGGGVSSDGRKLVNQRPPQREGAAMMAISDNPFFVVVDFVWDDWKSTPYRTHIGKRQDFKKANPEKKKDNDDDLGCCP